MSTQIPTKFSVLPTSLIKDRDSQQISTSRPHPMSIQALCHSSNVEVGVGSNHASASDRVLPTSQPIGIPSACSGKCDTACIKVRSGEIVNDSCPSVHARGKWKFWKGKGVARSSEKSLDKSQSSTKPTSLIGGDSANSTGSSSSSTTSLPTSTSDASTSGSSRPRAEGATKSSMQEANVASPCGKRCIAISNARAIMLTSSYDFSAFSTIPPPRLLPGQPRPERTPAVPCTSLPHTPGYLKRYHYAPKAENRAIEFAIAGACKDTVGAAMQDLLVYHGQCIVGAEEPIPSIFLGGKKGKVTLTIKLKGNRPSRKYDIVVQCECGTPITQGRLAMKIAHLYLDYCGPTDIIPLRLKSLFTEDNGITWKAQHAVVMEFEYKYEPGLRLPAHEMITKIEWRRGDR